MRSDTSSVRSGVSAGSPIHTRQCADVHCALVCRRCTILFRRNKASLRVGLQLICRVEQGRLGRRRCQGDGEILDCIRPLRMQYVQVHVLGGQHMPSHTGSVRPTSAASAVTIRCPPRRHARTQMQMQNTSRFMFMKSRSLRERMGRYGDD